MPNWALLARRDDFLARIDWRAMTSADREQVEDFDLDLAMSRMSFTRWHPSGAATTAFSDFLTGTSIMENIEMRCPYCGSASILKDAAAAWDAEAQEWTLVSVHDHETW
ncbi:MAG: hypothetical protein IPM41_06925 [Sphingomonadales bacterium]|nr:hypothetical protein [Sphingomonadales bacterium]